MVGLSLKGRSWNCRILPQLWPFERPMPRQTSVLLPNLLLVLLLFPASASPKARSEPCPPGRFLLPAGSTLITGGTPVPIDAIVLDARGSVGIESGCPLVPAKVKPTQNGTRVIGKWSACG